MNIYEAISAIVWQKFRYVFSHKFNEEKTGLIKIPCFIDFVKLLRNIYHFLKETM